MTFNCPLVLNKVSSEKIPLSQAHMLFRFAVYSNSYLDTNPKITIYRDTVFRGDTHPYFWIGMGSIFCPKIGLGKSLTALGFEKVSLFQIVRFVQGEQEENF